MRSIQVTEYRKVHISIVLHAGNSTLLEQKPSNEKFNQELLFNIQKQTGVDAKMPRERVIGMLITSIVFGSLLLCTGLTLSLVMLVNLLAGITEWRSGGFVVFFAGLLFISSIAAVCGLLILVPAYRWLRSRRPMDGGLYQDLMEDGVVVEGELINVRTLEIETPRGKQSATEIAYKYLLPNGKIRHDSYTVFSDYHQESNYIKLWYVAVREPDRL